MTDRREFLNSALMAACAAAPLHTYAGPQVLEDTRFQNVKSFNYQPSFGSSGFEIWRNFDPRVVKEELGRGVKYFPRMSAIRLWLSWDAFIRQPRKFAANFETALAVAEGHGLTVMPVLFNRWHDGGLDYGGIYVDHFLPGVSYVRSEKMFVPYLEMVVGGHAEDRRVFAWDLCNEPFSYRVPTDKVPDVLQAEFTWLEVLYRECKRLGAKAPLTVGITALHSVRGFEQINPISDVLSIHPYWMPRTSKADFEQLLDGYVAFANRVRKPVLATETCWGSLDDAERVAIIRYTLGELKKRRIGWLAYLLHHSLIADAHRPEFGPVGGAGTLAFIEADEALRPGHEVFNEF